MRQLGQKEQLTESKSVKLTNVFGQNAGECRQHGRKGDGADGGEMCSGRTMAPTTMQTLGAARCLSLLTIVSETLTECQTGTIAGGWSEKGAAAIAERERYIESHLALTGDLMTFKVLSRVAAWPGKYP